MCTHNIKICGKENRFLLTEFPISGGLRHSALDQPPPASLKSRHMPRSSLLLLICSPRLLLHQVPVSPAPRPLCLWGQTLHQLPAALTSVCCSLSPCASLRAREWNCFQDPSALLHMVVVSQGLEPSEARIPRWDPASGCWLPTMQGLSLRAPSVFHSHPYRAKQERGFCPPLV